MTADIFLDAFGGWILEGLRISVFGEARHERSKAAHHVYFTCDRPHDGWRAATAQAERNAWMRRTPADAAVAALPDIRR